MKNGILLPVEINKSEYEILIEEVGKELNEGRWKVASAINVSIVRTYWRIGKHIVEFEQKGHVRAEYGTDLLNRLSHDLSVRQ